MAVRPVATPEIYSGEGSFTDWVYHFKSVAKLNSWDDSEMAQWLAVRLVGRAQVAYKGLPDGIKQSYKEAISALQRRFEPDSKRSLYAAEFQARCKMPTEDWPTFADDLKTLADKAFPDLSEDARERLAVDRFLGQLEDPQLSFSVRQKQPTTIDDAVTITMELQSHLKLAQSSASPNFSVSAVSDKSRQPSSDRTIVLLEQLVSRMERLETELAHSDQGRTQAPLPSPNPRRRYRGRQHRSSQRPVICHRCGQEGHYARGCAFRAPPATENTEGDQGN